MISRRTALTLGAVSLAIPPFQSSPAFSHLSASDPTPSYPTGKGNPARTGEMPGPAPHLDQRIAVLWQFAAHGDSSQVNFNWWSGASIADEIIYTGGHDNLLYALDAATGAERWNFALEGSSRDAPTLHNGTVYVTTWGPNVYAIDAATGQEQWRYNVASNSTWGSVANDSTVFFSDGNAIHALDATTGMERWSFPAGGVASAPALEGETLVFTTVTDVHAVYANTGTEIWRYPAGSAFIVSPAVVDDTVFSGDFNHQLHALDIISGEEKWLFSPAPPSSDPGYNKHLKILSVSLKTIVANGDGILYAVDSETGIERWRISTDTRITPAAVVVDESALIAEDYLYVVDLISGQEQWRDSRFFGGESLRTFAAPIIKDSRVYVGFGEHFYALGNLPNPILLTDVTLRGAPSPSAIERGKSNAGDEIDNIGARDSRSGETWVEVTIAGVIGWIPLDSVDPATLPPEGEIEYVYIPE